MNTIAIMDSLSLELSSELSKVNSTWEKTVFGIYADVTAYISEGSADIVSIIPKATVPSTTMAMINENNEWVAKPAQYKTKRVPFISKLKKGSITMSHTNTDYDAGGPVRFCRNCGCTLIEVFDSIEDKLYYRHPKFGVDNIPRKLHPTDFEVPEKYLEAMNDYEIILDNLSICKLDDKILNGEIMDVEDITCGIANHKYGPRKHKLYHRSDISRIMDEWPDDRDLCQRDENGFRVDKCEYMEPSYKDTSEGVSNYNEGTSITDIQPSKLLTENKARNALECFFMDYMRGKETLKDLEARIFTTLRNGSIDLEEADYYRTLVGLPTRKDPEPTTPKKKFKRGVIGQRIIKSPKVKDGVEVTKIDVQPARSTNYKWIMEVNANFKNRKYTFVKGDKASHWIIKDQNRKSYLINDYCNSKIIMGMVAVVNNLVQKDWTKMINPI